MSPSGNKHFQHVEDNILALNVLHRDVMNAVHLSQHPACFLAAGTQPNTPKEGEVEDFGCFCGGGFFSIVASQYKSQKQTQCPH